MTSGLAIFFLRQGGAEPHGLPHLTLELTPEYAGGLSRPKTPPRRWLSRSRNNSGCGGMRKKFPRT
jgi:hypothetical protein